MVSEEDSPLQKCKHPKLPYQVRTGKNSALPFVLFSDVFLLHSTMFLMQLHFFERSNNKEVQRDT